MKPAKQKCYCTLTYVAGLCLTALLISGCDGRSVVATDNTADADANANSFLVEELQIDMLNQAEIEPFEREPALGFARPPNGAVYSRTTGVGTRHGNAFEVNCGADQVLVGVRGHVSGRIERVRPVCVEADEDGKWLGSPVVGGSQAGNTNGTYFEQRCPNDSAVFGMSGDFANDYPAYLQVHCRPLLNDSESSGASTSLQAVGNLAGRATTAQCADRAVATGLFGDVQTAIERLGMVCYEDPAHAGRWSSVVDWPLIAIHSAVLADGRVLTYGSGPTGSQGAREYDVWNPDEGTSRQSHSPIAGVTDVDSFCGAAMLLPSSQDILLPGGDARPQGLSNAGIRNALLLDTSSLNLSSVADMSYERWYTTSTMLPEGDVLQIGGINRDRNLSDIPEVYSPTTGQWRSLSNASMEGYGAFYPRQWVLSDGRVFSISQHRMFFLDTDGEGELTPAGTLPAWAYGNSGTAAMFAQDKIIYVGGTVSDGYGAALIDVTSGSPVVTQLDNLAESRRTWSESVLLADGKVMISGGSYLTNDAVTASLGVEVFDPDNNQWTQYAKTELPRLYHSTAVLLKDGRVLLAGGGAPGPLVNSNAEIFSPPYLFDEGGALADRPEITYAPDNATWAQSVGIRTTDDASISRITLVKTGSVTHSFNMDQRFLELNFEQQADALSVSMPATANLATPGFYMMFVHDSDGTPSIAQMLELGTQPAPDLPVIETLEPSTPLAANSLLLNGGFESGKQSWEDCAAANLTSPANISVEGSQSMKVTGGGCMYQVVSVEPGTSYALSCDVRGTAQEYASLTLQMLDASFSEIEAISLPIEATEFTSYNIALEASTSTVYAAVGVYSEGTTNFDRCELVPGSAPQVPTTPTPPIVTDNSLISNGGFEDGGAGWFNCAQASLTNVSADAANGSAAMQIENAGCLYQEFPVTAGKTYQMACQAKSAATEYSSLTLTLMNQNYTALDSATKPVGRNNFQTYQAQLFTPASGSIGAITLYSEDQAQFDDCVVVEL